MEEVKKYEFKKLVADDIFTMVNIISKIGINKFANCFKSEEVQELVKSLKGKKSVKSDDISLIVGGSIFLEVAQVILEGMPKCKDDVYTLLSNTSNLSIEDIKTLDGVTFFEMIIDFVKKEEFMDFIKAASRFANKGN
jgi:hypothetical protein